MNTTTETLDLVKTAQAAANQGLAEDVLAKGITQSTGLVAYDLEAPSKKVFPVLTPLRNEIPRVSGEGGTATNWKMVTGINTAGTPGEVSEGNRGAAVTTSVVSKALGYIGLGLEDYVTFEADYASKNFEDTKALAAFNLLQAVMIVEERMILRGNNSLALGTTPTPTLTTSTSGGQLAASTAYSVICVALTAGGLYRSTVSGGLTQQITKNNTDGSTDTINGGISQKSANATITTGSGSTNSVAATVTPVVGAVGYAWYFGAAGSERLSQITTINSAVFTTVPSSTQLASALSATDYSQNSMAFDGLYTLAMTPGNNGLFVTQATGVPGTGTPLTSDGAAGIVEIKTDFRWFWDNYRLSPDEIWLHAQEAININAKVIANGGAPLIRFTQPADGTHDGLTAGVAIGSILNPITGTSVRLRIHPDAAAGTILYRTKRLPYPVANIGNLMQVKTRREYYQLEWALRTRKYEYGVYADEVFQHYAPFSLGVRTNIANG